MKKKNQSRIDLPPCIHHVQHEFRSFYNKSAIADLKKRHIKKMLYVI